MVFVFIVGLVTKMIRTIYSEISRNTLKLI